MSNTGLNPALRPEHRLALADHLFRGYPAETEAVYREVAIPQYFQNGDPLIFQLRALQPGADATIQAEGLLVVQTNLFIDERTGRIDPQEGFFGNLHQNVSFIFVISPQHELIPAQRLHDPELAAADPDPMQDDPAEVLAVAEAWIHDERQDNLDNAYGLLNGLSRRTDLETSFRAVVQLNRFLYYLRTGDVAAASGVLTAIRGDEEFTADSEVMRILDTEADGMLLVYQELINR